MKKMFYLMLALLVLGVASMNAQVNIGSDAGPKKGAVLDLSQSAGSLGLILPTVSLDGATPFQLDGGSNGADAAGTIVYNDGKGALTEAGIYFWDGGKWLLVKASETGTPPTPEEVLDVLLNYSTLSFTAEGVADHTIIATVDPSTADNKTITWSGDKKGVFNYPATSQSGAAVPITASAAAAGDPEVNTTFTATANGHSKILTVTRVAGAVLSIPVLDVLLNYSTLSFTAEGVGDHSIIATVDPANADDKTITWSGDKKGVFDYPAFVRGTMLRIGMERLISVLERRRIRLTGKAGSGMRAQLIIEIYPLKKKF
ncbi:hypothetical protein FACS189413_16420 [Bacteroidia bacterium]|nr:hypothetical protein FACS189413_16420 [Bacteroidia bacterium]